MSSKPPFEQLRSRLSGKPWVQFQPCKRSNIGLSAGFIEIRDEPSTVGWKGLDTNLLTPPLSVDRFEIPPFKPTESDLTSLSRKNRRRRRPRRHRQGLERASTGIAEKRSVSSEQARKRLSSTSVPDLRHDMTFPRVASAAGKLLLRQQLEAVHIARRKDSVAKSVGSKRRSSLPRKPRRWTMPSKAAPTRVLSQSPTPTVTTTIIPSKDHPGSSNATAGTSQQNSTSSSPAENDTSPTTTTETPAMITLRRATSKKRPLTVVRRTSLRPDAIISFPTPKFNRTTSTYFSSFFSLNSASNPSKTAETFPTAVRQSSWSTGEDANPTMRKASVTADKVQLTANTIAAPAFTQVKFLPIPQTHSHSDEQELLTLSARRYSTTIVSGSSVHEIIWDENITSSSSEGSTSSAEPSPRKTSKTTARKCDKHDHQIRRQSVLVEKLEAQLRNIDPELSSRTSASVKKRRPQSSSRLQKLTTGFNLGILNKTATLNKKRGRRCDPDMDMDLKPTRLDHDVSSSDVDGRGFANLLPDEEDHVSPTTTEVFEFFPPIEGSRSQRSSISQDPVVMSVEPISADIIRSEPPEERDGKEKTRAQSTPNTPHPKSDATFRHTTTPHLRRRSSDRPTKLLEFDSGSRSRTWSITTSTSASKCRRSSDERTPLLLAPEEDCQDEAPRCHRPSCGIGERSKSESVLTPSTTATATATQSPSRGRVNVNIDPTGPGSRKMSVQDFVWKIERMGLGMKWGSTREGGEVEVEVAPGLVRRDSPRLPVSAMRKNVGMGRGGGGKLLSEVEEEEGVMWVGSCRGRWEGN